MVLLRMGDVSNFLLIVLRSSIWLFVPCKIRAPLKLKPSLSNSVPKCPRVAIHANFRVHLEPIIDPKFTDRPPPQAVTIIEPLHPTQRCQTYGLASKTRWQQIQTCAYACAWHPRGRKLGQTLQLNSRTHPRSPSVPTLHKALIQRCPNIGSKSTGSFHLSVSVWLLLQPVRIFRRSENLHGA